MIYLHDSLIIYLLFIGTHAATYKLTDYNNVDFVGYSDTSQNIHIFQTVAEIQQNNINIQSSFISPHS